MSEDGPKKYTTSDYTVLNEHFNQALARDNEIIRARRATTFWQNAKSWALLLFFIGIAAMFIGKAYYLAKEEKIVQINNPGGSPNTNSKSTVTIEGEEVSVITDVVHFKQLETTYKNKKYTVMTRHNYEDPRDTRPKKQSCYASNFGFDIELSIKDTKDNITIKKVSNQIEVANVMGLNDTDIKYLSRYCQYI